MSEQSNENVTVTTESDVRMTALVIRNSLCPEWPGCMEEPEEGSAKHSPDMHAEMGFTGQTVSAENITVTRVLPTLVENVKRKVHR